LPKAWIKERKKEYYYRKAKEEKYRSRAAYKLLQVARKYQFIKPSYVVVDLGAAPGGWLQVSQKLVGEKGFILGVDLKPIPSFDLPNVHTIVSDITDPQTVSNIKEILPHPADVVISDVSPNISGVWELDHARQIGLARKSLQIAVSILKSKGNFFMKVFQGDMFNDFLKEVKQHFTFVKLIKPKASRARSAELYILAMVFVKNHGK
jgi:23S rRNA (uridine2552-2'-O)-methyltransferase